MSLIKKIPDISKEEITRIDKLTRENICNEIKDKLLYLEKYSTSKDNNKMTYMMIPYDHPTYSFPYNLEDRLKYKIDRFNKIVERKINHVVTSSKNKDKYELTFKNDKFMDEKNKIRAIEKEGFILKSNVWTLVIE